MTGPTFSIKLENEEFTISIEYLNTVKQILVALELQTDGIGSG